MIWFVFALFNLATAQTIQSDCTPQEMKVVATLSKFSAVDCSPIKVNPDNEQLLIAGVINGPSGHEVYVSIYTRKGFTVASSPEFKSQIIGYDLFPILINQTYRLVFLHPSSDKTHLALYMNIQTAPSATHFSRWEFNYEAKDLKEANNRIWAIEAGVLPKLYDERGTFRALLETRSVEI